MSIKFNGTLINKYNVNPCVTAALGTEATTAFDHKSLDFDTQNSPPSIQIPASEASGPATAPCHGENVIHLDAADSFLDIFCEQKHDPDTMPEQHDAPVKGGIQAVFGGRIQGLHKFSMFFRELKVALGSEKPRRRSRSGFIIVVLFIVVVLGSGHYLPESPKKDFALLLKEGHYDECLARSNEYLLYNPQAEDVQKLATEALVHAIVPNWGRLIEAKQFDQAADLVTDGVKRGSANPDGVKLLTLLRWIGDLERFMFERGGVNTPIVLFRDEDTILNLLNRWNADVAGNQGILVRIGNYIPSFQQTIQVRVNRYIRVFQSEQKSYLKAIEELNSNLKVLLTSEEPNEAISLLNLFKKQYPNVAGTNVLMNDISRFVELRQAITTHNLHVVLRLYKTQYQTPLVTDIVTWWIATHLPQESGMNQYREAVAAWRTGDVDTAVALLKGLTDEAWGEMASAKITRFSDIAKAFAELGTSFRSSDDHQRVLAFYKTLDVSEDTYFINAIEFQVYVIREVVSAKAEQLHQEAITYWNDYQNSGGITGLLRLEKAVSKRFHQQAQLLTTALMAVRHASKLYSLAKNEIPSEQRQLHDAVQSEAVRQRQWVSDLGLVLESSLLETKLQLLPNPTENEK
jgi:hypothetical protein